MLDNAVLDLHNLDITTRKDLFKKRFLGITSVLNVSKVQYILGVMQTNILESHNVNEKLEIYGWHFFISPFHSSQFPKIIDLILFKLLDEPTSLAEVDTKSVLKLESTHSIVYRSK